MITLIAAFHIKFRLCNKIISFSLSILMYYLSFDSSTYLIIHSLSRQVFTTLKSFLFIPYLLAIHCHFPKTFLSLFPLFLGKKILIVFKQHPFYFSGEWALAVLNKCFMHSVVPDARKTSKVWFSSKLSVSTALLTFRMIGDLLHVYLPVYVLAHFWDLQLQLNFLGWYKDKGKGLEATTPSGRVSGQFLVISIFPGPSSHYSHLWIAACWWSWLAFSRQSHLI